MATIETKEVTILDMLSKDSVSVLKKIVADINGQEVQVGENLRRAFNNSTEGRQEITEFLKEPYLSSVMQVWGDSPTVVEEEPIQNSETVSE